MVSPREALRRKVAKAARHFQQRSKETRPKISIAAAKIGVSPRVFRRALDNPSKTLKIQAEVTRIRRVKAAKTAADVQKSSRVKYHAQRTTRKLRQPIRKEHREKLKEVKQARTLTAEERRAVGKLALWQQSNEVAFYSKDRQLSQSSVAPRDRAENE